MAGTDRDDSDTPSARELSRRRSRRARPAATGRVHHLGEPPAAQPVHTDDGLTWTETSPVRLRELSTAQLDALLDRLHDRIARASEALEYERAGALLAELREAERYRAERPDGRSG